MAFSVPTRQLATPTRLRRSDSLVQRVPSSTPSRGPLYIAITMITFLLAQLLHVSAMDDKHLDVGSDQGNGCLIVYT